MVHSIEFEYQNNQPYSQNPYNTDEQASRNNQYAKPRRESVANQIPVEMQGRPAYKPDTYQEPYRAPLPMNYPSPYQMGNPPPYGYPYQAPYYPPPPQPINIINNNNNNSAPAANNNNNNIVVNVTAPPEKKPEPTKEVVVFNNPYNNVNCACPMCGYTGRNSEQRNPQTRAYVWCILLLACTIFLFWYPFVRRECYETKINCGKCGFTKETMNANSEFL